MRVFFRSFVYALSGIAKGIQEERNLRFHFCIAVYVYLFSLFYEFSRQEYVLLTIMVAGVIALELVNSALERAVSKPSPEEYVTAGVVKDMAAGAVFVFSIGSAVGGVFLFWDIQVFSNITSFFIINPLLLFLLLFLLAVSVWFVFFFGRTDNKKKKQ